jgi:hypothetical protein
VPDSTEIDAWNHCRGRAVSRRMTNALPGFDSPRPSTSLRASRPARAAAAALLAASLAACSTGPAPSATPGASGGPTTGPTPSPTAPTVPTGGLEHPTGAKDIVLRFEESGGFVPIEHNATYAPSFTLYGDGTVVFRDPYAAPPETNNNVRLSTPFQTVKLDEAAVQALLEQALNQGGLAVATGPYTCNCADIPTATFTISIGGETKQVSVTGMSPDLHGQNGAIVQQLANFAEVLRTFADKIPGETPYLASGYRGILFEVEQPFGPVVAWPWTDLTPTDFASGENEFFKTAALTPAQVEALGIDGVEGGLTGVAVQSEGKLYTFSLRPLLPDESK